tara:strand:+ start:533 stop:1093 length:561 start_codon:yes stop_codon:yes gene_type:complete
MLGLSMQHRTLAAFVALTMLLMSTSGCLGLLQGREYMESLRGEPKQDESYTPLSIDHTFVNAQQESWDEDFKIDSAVTEISVYFKASFFLSDQLPDEIDPRFVDVSIKDSDGNEMWSKRTTTTESSLEEKIEPQENGKFLSGDWNIFVEASGGGLAGIGEDSFLVTITVTRTCIEFPQDDGECVTL